MERSHFSSKAKAFGSVLEREIYRVQGGRRTDRWTQSPNAAIAFGTERRATTADLDSAKTPSQRPTGAMDTIERVSKSGRTLSHVDVTGQPACLLAKTVALRDRATVA